MESIFLFFVSFLLSLTLFFKIIPKQNPYLFPKPHEIDKYEYIDNKGVCYKYLRKYI